VITRAAIAVSLFVVSIGCHDDAPVKKKATHDDLARVSILERGAEPRQMIRWSPAVGGEREIVVTTTSLGRAIRETVAVRVPTMTPEGGARYEASLREVELIDSPGSEEEARLKNAQGSLAWANVTRQGYIRESKIEGDDGAHSIATWMRFGIVPFPDEPVGSGAKWEVEAQGRLVQYELAAFDGRRAVVRLREEQPAAALAAAGSLTQGEVVVDLKLAPPDRMTLTVNPGAGDARGRTVIAAEVRN
jgi:hypothetical protein